MKVIREETPTAAAPDGLESLAREAEALTPPPLGEGVTDLDVSERDAAPAVPAMTNAQCVLMAAQVLRTMLTTVAKLETPGVTMADEKIEPAAAALGAVFDKHGWNLQALAGDYTLELAALGTAGPIAWATYTGIQAEIKARPKTDVKAKADDKPPVPAAGVSLDANADQVNKPPEFAPNDPRSVSLNVS